MLVADKPGGSHVTRALVAALALTAALMFGACGSDDESLSAARFGNSVDLAFVNEMTPHHGSAIAMATVARKRSARAEVTGLAAAIIKSRTAEIAEMFKLAASLEDEGISAARRGVSGRHTVRPGDATALETADPIDRAFIDMMVPHGQDAIRMARAVLANGQSAEVKTLAEGILDAESREVGEMNELRKRWYGKPATSGDSE